MSLNVFPSRAMTPLTGNTKDNIVSVVVILGWRGTHRLEECCMTLEATGRHGAIKVRRPVYISRAVDPTMDFRPIRHRKLEQAILPPIEIGLAFGGRPDNEIDLLRLLRNPTSLLSNGSLVEMTIACLHPEGEFGVKRGQNVLALHEAPRDGTCIRQP